MKPLSELSHAEKRIIVTSQIQSSKTPQENLPMTTIESLRGMMNKFKCELCNDTGYYGDNGPGIRGNREYMPCECRESLNPSEVTRRLRKIDSFGPAYGYNHNDAIGLVFRCDMMTAQNIVNRIGDKLGIGHDPIVVLKIADALLISQCALEELEKRGAK
jgi:hypothetical protein